MIHFIITRFNLKKPDWNRDKNSRVVLDEKWLKNRIRLFEEFCLPSVIAQTNKNFKWLIFFEESSRPELISLMERIQKENFIEPLFVNGYKEFQENLSSLLNHRINSFPKQVLTTRLDNDDAIHQDFVKEIQDKIYDLNNDSVVYFPYGLCLDLGKRNSLALQHYPLNQFITFVEKNDTNRPLKTVFCREHDNWEESFNVVPLKNKVMWLQVSHDQNMINNYKGSPVFRKLLKGFSTCKIPFNWFYDIKVALITSYNKAS